MSSPYEDDYYQEPEVPETTPTTDNTATDNTTDTTNTETGDFGRTVELPAFTVTGTKINEEPNMNEEISNYESTSPNGDQGDLGSAIGDFFAGLGKGIANTASNIAKSALTAAQQRANQSLGQNKSTSTTTNRSTTSSTTNVMGLSPTMLVVAAVAVGLLVYAASRQRSAA